jgi:hypothetical protein
MPVAHEEFMGKTSLFADHRRCSGQPDGEPFRPAAQPAGEDFGCARPERRPATFSRRIPAPQQCALLAECPDAPAITETRQAAAIRQARAKICENYLRADRARYTKKAPSEKSGHYTVDHTGVVYLMDRRGKLVSAFNLRRPPQQAACELEPIFKTPALNKIRAGNI